MTFLSSDRGSRLKGCCKRLAPGPTEITVLVHNSSTSLAWERGSGSKKEGVQWFRSDSWQAMHGPVDTIAPGNK